MNQSFRWRAALSTIVLLSAGGISGAVAQAPPVPPEQLPPPGECCLFSRAVNTCTRYSKVCLEESPNGVCIRFQQPPECLQWEMQQRCVKWGPCPKGGKGRH